VKILRRDVKPSSKLADLCEEDQRNEKALQQSSNPSVIDEFVYFLFGIVNYSIRAVRVTAEQAVNPEHTLDDND
jgi:hypothetical protein